MEKWINSEKAKILEMCPNLKYLYGSVIESQ
jgi:hypothetical protein